MRVAQWLTSRTFSHLLTCQAWVQYSPPPLLFFLLFSHLVLDIYFNLHAMSLACCMLLQAYYLFYTSYSLQSFYKFTSYCPCILFMLRAEKMRLCSFWYVIPPRYSYFSIYPNCMIKLFHVLIIMCTFCIMKWRLYIHIDQCIRCSFLRRTLYYSMRINVYPAGYT